ncbi:uncharacterized protein LAJ45_11372 [Morchella importuna]|uniref:uncharacterized protein n=1 Tax=Morchella importuna TaxID=1174673 RepID=UPI001E8E4935|nr:uncharacterized protein LAJ45_11372 [Morchella importuna]KAH8144604.1 hypothetical protein LAJ45_11372 [Morchella importuna]
MADADSDSNSTVELHRDDDLALELERFGDRNRGARGHSNTSLLSQEVHDYGSVCIDSVRLPFLADSIRQDAVYHYGCIKELQSPKNPDTGSGSESSVSGSIVLVESYKEMEAERLRSLTIFRDLLLADLTSLLDKIQELENKLLGRKERYQIASRIHCGLGLGLVEIRKICTIFTAIGVYTLYMLHSAHRYRKAMASTSNMRKEIARFVRKVEKKQLLVDKDIEGLKGAKWDEVPWKEVETEPSWKLLSGL